MEVNSSFPAANFFLSFLTEVLLDESMQMGLQYCRSLASDGDSEILAGSISSTKKLWRKQNMSNLHSINLTECKLIT